MRMKKSVYQTALLYAGLAGAFVLFDLALDRLIGGTPALNWPHLILATVVVLSSFVVLSRALETRNQAEAVLRQAHDNLEAQVQVRTAELARANEALQVEIAERKQMEGALRESKRQLDTMFQTLVEGMVVVDLTGQIIAANRAAGRILDIHQDAMVGKYYNTREWRQIDEHGQPYPLDQLPLAVALRERRHVGPVEHPIIAPDGELKWISVNAAPLLDENAQLYGAVASFRDITERKQMESVLRKRTHELGERMKELKCLFDISELAAKPGITLEEMSQRTVDLVPRAWQYPEITCVRISLEGRAFRTENWQDSTWKQSSDIMVHGERVGAVEVGYLEERPTSDEGPFLKEERDLLNAIAERLGKITERMRAEAALRRAQSELEQRIHERTALEERQRLARELHDSVSQALYGISLGAHTALTWLDRNRGKVVEALDYVLSLTQAGLTEMRALIFELRPESLEMEGLVAALNKQAAALRARREIEVKLELCDEPDIPLETKEALYRIAQEALQNAVKHARPSRLDVRLVCDAESIVLEVCDDGVGFDPIASFPGHLGLRSMRERATRRGGTLDIVSAPGGGTRIRACVPPSAAQVELPGRDRRDLT
jgi:PAS domain S-box-containing protein